MFQKHFLKGKNRKELLVTEVADPAEKS